MKEQSFKTFFMFKNCRNGDDYDTSVPIEFNRGDDFDNGETSNVELVNTRIVESSTDMH